MQEVDELRIRLAEAQAALDAIRTGSADAFIGGTGDVFHLNGSEKPYVTFFSAMNEGGVTLDGAGAILHGNPRFVAMMGRPIENLRNSPIVSCVIADDRWRVDELLRNSASAVCEVSLDAPVDPLPVRLSLKTIDTATQRFRCIVITDLSEYAKAEAELRKAMEQHREAETQLRQQERDLRSILDHVPSMIGYWNKDLRNRFGNHAYQGWFGINPEQMAGQHIREVIGERAFQLDLPHIEAALRGESQIFERVIPIAGGAGLRHSLTHYIPDEVDGRVQGFYALVTDVTAAKEGEAAIRQSEESLRATYANLQAMFEAERKHVAREVHDELGQTLTALRMETSLLQRELRGQEASLLKVNEMRLLIESMFKTVRSIAGNLRPSTLDLGLVPAIEWLAEDFENRWQINCVLDIEPREIQASDTYATTVFRVIQESLTNVIRHANASHVDISLRQLKERILLEIQDNGRGFVQSSQMSGFGLIGMRERVHELGGTLTILSAPAQGTNILIDLPFAMTP